MAPTTRVFTIAPDRMPADRGALTALYEEHGGPAPADLAGLLDWSDATGALLTAIVVEGAGGFDAAILLTHHRVAGVVTIRLAGHRWADQQIVPARTPEAAAQLAAAVCTWLGGFRRWRLDLEQLRVEDGFVRALAARHRSVSREPGDPLPYLTWPTTRTPTTWAPKKFRQQSRQAHRRLTEECGEPSFSKHDSTDDILARLTDYHRVFAARERELGRPSAMADPGIATTKQSVLRRLGDERLLQSWELRAGGDLIAYYLTVQVGGTRRMWDGRMAPGWTHVSPGTILMAHVLQEWHLDPAIHRVDFMRGSNEFKRRLSNGEIATERLRVWSTPRLAETEILLRTLDDRGRRRVRAVRDRSPALQRLVQRLR